MTLFGREEGLASLRTVASASRLTTLVGPSGIGKTRLATAFAEEDVDGATVVLFAENLSSMTEEALLDCLASARDQNPPSGGGGGNDWIAALRGCRTLVVDGADAIAPLLASLVPQWLAANADLHIVATSRAPLDLSAERLFAVPPIDTDAARELFLARAVNVDNTFAPSDSSSLERVLASTSGIPLAVELAAAQMRTKTCAELADDLDGSEHRLESLHRDAPPRHRSLSLAIATSVDALSPAAAHLFSIAGAFAGPMTRHALCTMVPTDVLSTLVANTALTSSTDLGLALDELVHASLLTPVRAKSGMRFSFLRPVQAFAKHSLALCADAEAIRVAHLEYFARKWSPAATIDHLDIADLLLASQTTNEDRRGVDDDSATARARCTLALISEAVGRGAAHDVKVHLDRLSIDGVSPRIEAAGWCARARFGLVFLGTSMSDALAYAQRALDRADIDGSPDDDTAVAIAVDIAALVALDRRLLGSTDVEDAFETALRLAESFGHSPWVHRIRSDYAAAMFERRNLSAARTLFLEVIDESVASGDTAGEGVARTNLALVLQESGAVAAAKKSMGEALALHRKVGNDRFEAITLSDFGALSVEQSLWLAARTEFTAAVEALAELGDHRHEAIGRSALAFVHALLGANDAADVETMRAQKRLGRNDDDPFSLVLALHGCGQTAATAARRRLVHGATDVAPDRLLEKMNALADAPLGNQSDEVRLARRLAGVALDALATSPLATSIDGATYWVGGTRVDLRDKKAHQRIFAALVVNRLTNALGLDKTALVSAGWPDEKMVETSARNRLHVAIAGLRKGGLGDTIALEDGLYRLTPNAPLVVAAGNE